MGENNMNNKKSNKKVFLIIITVLLIVFAVVGINLYLQSVNYVTTDDAKVSSNIISASSKIPGKVADIKVTEGSVVKKGDVLFTLETDQAQAQVNQAKAALDVVKAQLDKVEGGARSQEVSGAQALVDEATAGLSGMQTTKTNLKNTLNSLKSQYNTLLSKMSSFKNPSTGKYDANYVLSQLDTARKVNAISDGQYTVKAQSIEQLFSAKQQLEDQISELNGQINAADSQISAAQANINASNSKLSLTKAGASNKDIAIAEDQVKALQTSYDLAKLGVGSTVVKAPLDSTVVQVNVHVGDTIAAGSAAFSLVDFSKLQVTAYVLEGDLERVKLGQSVNLSVDSYSGTTFTGKVKQIGLATASTFSLFSTDNNSGNYTKVSQRVPVKIDFVSTNGHLIPGMSVTAKINVK